MAGSASPEKVKELLSSFLVKANNLENKNKTASPCKTGNPDNGHDDLTSATTANAASSFTSNLRSFQKFLERLDTFSAITWFGKPSDLSPIICARYGWENVDVDMLQCVGCKAFLSGQLPSKINFELYNESLSKLKKNLLASHDKFCVLAVNPCPEHFCHVPVDDPVNLLSSFSQRLVILSKIQDRLPHIDETDLQAMGYDSGQGGAYCKRNLVPDVDVSPQAVALAFTGWTCNAPSPDVLTCSMCRRHVGLWNFVSHSSLVVNREISKDRSSDEETEDGEPKEKRRKISVPVKESLNPVGEHHHWCPWIQETPLPSPPPSTSGAALSTPSRSDCGKSSQTAPAYIVALRNIAPGLMDNNKGLATTMKTSPMVEGLRYFRRVIRAWSSPKVQISTSSYSPS